MSEKHEVADAVIAEMRDEAARADTEQYYTLDDAAESMREFAERLDEALKRERAAFDCECAGIADLAAKEEAARHKPGNAAAMREALELFVEYSELVCKMGMFNCDRLIAITTKARAALSAPPRNCDVYANDAVAQFACLGESLANGVHGMSLAEYHKWLFAEAKGEYNESKKEEE